MKKITFCFIVISAFFGLKEGFSQSIGINNDNSLPSPSAILDIKSTTQGVLFPRMSQSQRNALVNPANGLHIFNTTTGALEYYDSLFNIWSSYCPECAYFTDTLKCTGTDTTYYGYSLPPTASGYRKIIIVIEPNVMVLGNAGNGAVGINLLPAATGSSIIIKNYGQVIGNGGTGGTGGDISQDAQCIANPAQAGNTGGDAIVSKAGTKLTVHNYGTIAGGGGGGGGGAAGTCCGGNTGGGGGGGAGSTGGNNRGLIGKEYYWNNVIHSCVLGTSLAQYGETGTLTAGGNGGNGGQTGSPLFAGYAGGNGGGLGQPGQNGQDSFYNTGGPGGLPGKAISGNPGNNTVSNSGGGVVYGAVD
jgi:hypothetical protein